MPRYEGTMAAQPAANLGYQQATGRPDMPGPFGHAAETFVRVQDLSQRVQRLSTRLIGPTPMPPREGEAQQAQSLSGGVFEALAMTCAQVDMEIADANDALTRIESALP